MVSIPIIQVIGKKGNVLPGHFKLKVVNLNLPDDVEHVSTTWVLRKENDIVFKSEDDKDNKLEIQIDNNLICIGDGYTVEVIININNNGNAEQIKPFDLPFIADFNLTENCCNKCENNLYLELIRLRKDKSETLAKLVKAVAYANFKIEE